MNELRKDYLLNRFVIISPRRGNRPELTKDAMPAGGKRGDDANVATCPFCPGNWPSLGQPSFEASSGGKPAVRVIQNKFSAVSLEGNPELTTHNTFYTFASAYGVAEVVIDTPDHGREFEELPVEHIVLVLKAYQDRIRKLSAVEHIKYVSIFKNRGKEAGASILHTHSQVIAHNMLPPWIDEELMAHYHHVIEHGDCPYRSIIAGEKDSYRRISEDERMVAFTPYASRFAYEAWIFPKQHLSCITDLDEAGLFSLAQMLKKILLRLDELPPINGSTPGRPPYNLQFHTAELAGENFHFHIEITPRLNTWAGFELESGTIINTVSPEDAARFYRRE